MKITKWLAALLSLSLLLLTLPGCGSTGYQTFSIKEGIQGFSFEYPQAYSLIRIDLSDTSASQYTTIGLGATIDSVISEIYIYIWPASPDMSNATDTLDNLLTNAQGVLTDYSLDKRATTTVDNEIAQGASFNATDTDSTTSTSTGPAYYRVTCFIHNAWIVELDMTCDVSLKATTQGDYDHLLQTFGLVS